AEVTADRTISFTFAPVDTTPPTVTISGANNVELRATTTITFTLSEAPGDSTTFELNDITATGGTMSGLTTTGLTRTATFTAGDSATTAMISVAANRFTDAAGNGNTVSNTLRITVADTTDPTVTITGATTIETPGTATITFTTSEATTDFALGDITVSGGAGTLGSFTGSGMNYTATFTAGDSAGTAMISVAANRFNDAAGNGNEASAVHSITITNAVPTITITSANSTVLTDGTVAVTFTLSENSTDFTDDDITLNPETGAGTLSGFSGSGRSYTATFTAGATAAMATISVAANTFTDAAGNGNTVSNMLVININDVDIVQVLNETVLTQAAVAMSHRSVHIVETQIRDVFISRRSGAGMSMGGESLGQFLNSKAEQMVRSAMPGESGALQLNLPGFSLSDMDFTMGLNGAEGDDRTAYTIWGRGYYSSSSVDEATSYDSDLSGGMIGVDALFNSNLLVGLALNHGVNDASWRIGDATGDHKTSVIGVYPYFGWQLDNGLHFWGTVGISSGDTEITNDSAPSNVEERDVEMRSFALGGYKPSWEIATGGGGAAQLGFVGEVNYTQAEETDSNLGATKTGSVRFGMKVDYNRMLEGDARMGSNLELTYRSDFGDYLTGSGMEVGGGVDFLLPGTGLRVDLNARTLLAHSDELDEWGISGGVSWSPTVGGRGLSLAFKPQWGDVGSDSKRLWDSGLSGFGSDAASTAGRYSLELKYGIPVLRDRELLTLFARSNLQSTDGNTTLGTDLKLGKYFSTGYEAAVMETETDHRGYIRYQKGF
ncbi:MAG: Ig-like domain-containing protein, partial [Gammaproteobacteria bacterium]